MKSDKILVGVKAFEEFIGVSAPIVYKLFKKGLPGAMMEGRVYGHADNVNEFFRVNTMHRMKDVTDEYPEDGS